MLAWVGLSKGKKPTPALFPPLLSYAMEETAAWHKAAGQTVGDILRH